MLRRGGSATLCQVADKPPNISPGVTGPALGQLPIARRSAVPLQRALLPKNYSLKRRSVQALAIYHQLDPRWFSCAPRTAFGSFIGFHADVSSLSMSSCSY